MAGEIQVTAGLSVDKGTSPSDYSDAKEPGSVAITMSGDDYVGGTQLIGTSAENIGMGEISTAGYMWVKNLGPTNYVELGYDDTGFKNFVKLKVGEPGTFRLAQDQPQAKADTAAVRIEYRIYED